MFVCIIYLFIFHSARNLLDLCGLEWLARQTNASHGSFTRSRTYISARSLGNRRSFIFSRPHCRGCYRKSRRPRLWRHHNEPFRRRYPGRFSARMYPLYYYNTAVSSGTSAAAVSVKSKKSRNWLRDLSRNTLTLLLSSQQNSTVDEIVIRKDFAKVYRTKNSTDRRG